MMTCQEGRYFGFVQSLPKYRPCEMSPSWKDTMSHETKKKVAFIYRHLSSIKRRALYIEARLLQRGTFYVFATNDIVWYINTMYNLVYLVHNQCYESKQICKFYVVISMYFEIIKRGGQSIYSVPAFQTVQYIERAPLL